MSRKKSIYIYVLSFLIPTFVLTGIFIAMDFVPFGSKGFFNMDIPQQYIALFSYWKSILKGENGLIYSFSQSLGGEMIGTISYFCLSPLNLLLILFEEKNFSVFFMILFTLKVSLSSLTFAIYLNHRWEKGFSILFFSIAYGLMSFVFAYGSNIMWLDAVYILPCIVLELDKFMKSKKLSLWYVFWLTAVLITNFYMGYMVCLFLVIYMIYLLFAESFTWEDRKNYIFYFTCYSVLAALVSSIILVPTFFSIMGGRGGGAIPYLGFDLNFNWLEFFSKCYTGAWSQGQDINGIGMPNIYAGALVVLFLGIYFLNRQIPIRKRLASVFLLSALILIMQISGYNIMWHIFKNPTGYPYRYSWFFTFLTIVFACDGYCSMHKTNRKRYFYVLICYIGVTGLMVFGDYNYLSWKKLFFDVLVLVCLYMLLVHWNKKICMFFALVIHIVNLGMNGYIILHNMTYLSNRDYIAYLNSTSELLNLLRQEDDGFYRIEKDFYLHYRDYPIVNDSFLFKYNGLSSFNSCTKEPVKKVVSNLGYQKNSLKVIYGKGSTPAADALLGIKYILSKDDRGDQYVEVKTMNDIHVFENPYVLPLAYTVNQDVLNVKENDNTFEYQNSLFSAMLNKEIVLFEKVQNVSASTTNMVTVNEVTNMDIADNRLTFIPEDSQKPSSLTYTMNGEMERPLYHRWEASASGIVYQKDELLHDFRLYNTWYTDTFHVYPKKGNLLTQLYNLNGYIKINDTSFYTLNEQVLRHSIDEIKKNETILRQTDESNVRCEVTVNDDNQLLIFSIPYEKGWDCYVDGQKTDINVAMGGLMAVPIRRGKHDILLKFIPQGLILGGILSLLGLTFATLLLRRTDMNLERLFKLKLEKR